MNRKSDVAQSELAAHTVKIIRAEIARLTYPGRPVTISPDNLEALANEYDSAVNFRQTVADALAALRGGYTLRADGEGASIPWRAATDLARQELDATIAKLGLAQKENE
jgi:hypothetical protein